MQELLVVLQLGELLGNFTGGKGAAISSSVSGTAAYIMGGGGAVGLWARK